MHTHVNARKRTQCTQLNMPNRIYNPLVEQLLYVTVIVQTNNIRCNYPMKQLFYWAIDIRGNWIRVQLPLTNDSAKQLPTETKYQEKHRQSAYCNEENSFEYTCLTNKTRTAFQAKFINVT